MHNLGGINRYHMYLASDVAYNKTTQAVTASWHLTPSGIAFIVTVLCWTRRPPRCCSYCTPAVLILCHLSMPDMPPACCSTVSTHMQPMLCSNH